MVVANGIAVNPRVFAELRVDERVNGQGCERVSVGPGESELGETCGAEGARPCQRFGRCLVTEDRDGARNSTIDREGGGESLDCAGHLVERSTRNGVSL